MTSGTHARLDVAFPSDGDDCRAWLFMPEAERPPVVILGHGLGGTREYGLEPYAQRFADAGIAALLFTYRHFGDSGGQPRQLLDIERQLGDWGAALAYARSRDGIDHDRIALWGTSFAGGHVIERHGSPELGMHALQIEVDRRCYLTAAGEPNEGFDDVAQLIEALALQLGQALLDQQLPQAAE